MVAPNQSPAPSYADSAPRTFGTFPSVEYTPINPVIRAKRGAIATAIAATILTIISLSLIWVGAFIADRYAGGKSSIGPAIVGILIIPTVLALFPSTLTLISTKRERPTCALLIPSIIISCLFMLGSAAAGVDSSIASTSHWTGQYYWNANNHRYERTVGWTFSAAGALGIFFSQLALVIVSSMEIYRLKSQKQAACSPSPLYSVSVQGQDGKNEVRALCSIYPQVQAYQSK
eukprot:TRINITY_DN2306_c0_g1_i1.p1 TRINITY_DN2306_c0_g1~~TRINITY_DN2306_c0_g1_i1.p1  ORF type:complete len:232 (+),score=27.65 TRINITY_DN2306_c0_g1_i1:118-813(+)